MAAGSITSKFTFDSIGEWFQQQAKSFIPPLLALFLLLAAWQVLCSGKKPPLPPPTKVWEETQDQTID